MKINVFLAVITFFMASLFGASVQALTYTYDPLNRLTRVVYDNGNSVDYSYDAGGNITQVTKTVVGICGSSNGATLTAPPSSDLCSSGTASGSGLWNWDCIGTSNTANCSATIKTYAVSFSSGGNGTLTGTASQTVNHGASTSEVTAVPATGHHFVNWTEGAAVVNATAALTVSNVTATHAYTANFAADPVPVNGACGRSHGRAFRIAPSENLCSFTNTTPVVTGSGPWSWSCTGSNSGTTADCAASIDITAPALAVSTLANGAVTNNATLNVSGTASDAGGIRQVTVNGLAATITNDAFTIAITLVDGPNSIITIATDNAGNNTTDTRSITLDRTAPGLTINQPADNIVTGKTFVEINGTVDDQSATVTAQVNSSPVINTTRSGTNISATLNLVSGQNTLVITATDQAGNSSSAKRTVTSDTAAPTLAVNIPAQDISTTQSSVAISGTVTDTVTAATISISADGQTYTPPVASDGGFTQTINLPTLKTYAVIVTATDQAGNQATVQRNIIKNAASASGDINGDGVVDISDALRALQIAVGLVTPSAAELASGDVAPLLNGAPQPDGVIDVGDAFLLLRKSVGSVTW